MADDPGKVESVESKPFAVFPDSASFAARMDRAARSGLEEAAKSVGFPTVEELLAAAKGHRESSEKDKTMAQKAEEKASKYLKEKETAEARTKEALVKAAVTVQASALGIVDPDAAFTLMPKDRVTVNDQLEVIGVKEALAALLKEKPYLKGSGSTTTPTRGGSDFSGKEKPLTGVDMNAIIRRLAGKG